MAELNLTLLSLLFVDCNPSGARLEEGDGYRQSDGLALFVDALENDGLELAIFEGR